MGGRHLTREYIALLRGINVGGARVLPMAELRELVAGLGCSDVRSYIASGNLLFRASRGAAIGPAISAAIEHRWGYDVPVMLRTTAEFSRVIAANPFTASDGARYVGLFASEPDPTALDIDRSPPDRWAIANREIYFAYPEGRGRTTLTPAYVEAALGLPVTVRNWNTIAKLAELAGVIA